MGARQMSAAPLRRKCLLDCGSGTPYGLVKLGEVGIPMAAELR